MGYPVKLTMGDKNYSNYFGAMEVGEQHLYPEVWRSGIGTTQCLRVVVGVRVRVCVCVCVCVCACDQCNPPAFTHSLPRGEPRCAGQPASHSGHSDVVVCHTADGVSYDRFVAKAGTVIEAGPLGMQGRNGIFTQDALVSTRYRSRPDRFC